jgi:hypothetical protein
MSPSSPTLAPVPSGVETASLHRLAIHYNKFVMHDGVSIIRRSLYFDNSAFIACAIQCYTVGCTVANQTSNRPLGNISERCAGLSDDGCPFVRAFIESARPSPDYK